MLALQKSGRDWRGLSGRIRLRVSVSPTQSVSKAIDTDALFGHMLRLPDTNVLWDPNAPLVQSAVSSV